MAEVTVREFIDHVGNHLLPAQRQHAGAGASLGHGQDIVGGDALIALAGRPKFSSTRHRRSGCRSQTMGLNTSMHPCMGCSTRSSQALGLGHAQALGQQIGKQNEQRGHRPTKDSKTPRFGPASRQPQRNHVG